MKVIVAGGVAGGASCAARLRRLDEHAEILMVAPRPTTWRNSGQRAYAATRILAQNGFTARNISGGMLSRAMWSRR